MPENLQTNHGLIFEKKKKKLNDEKPTFRLRNRETEAFTV